MKYQKPSCLKVDFVQVLEWASEPADRTWLGKSGHFWVPPAIRLLCSKSSVLIRLGGYGMA